jgi:hypothetical protein
MKDLEALNILFYDKNTERLAILTFGTAKMSQCPRTLSTALLKQVHITIIRRKIYQ